MGEQTGLSEEGFSADDPARRMCQRLLLRDESPPRRGLLYSIYSSATDFHPHKWMYDQASMVKLMSEAGFVRCEPKAYRESRIPLIDDVEMSGRVLNGAGVAAEGFKPGG
jgi:hypothetical protein